MTEQRPEQVVTPEDLSMPDWRQVNPEPWGDDESEVDADGDDRG